MISTGENLLRFKSSIRTGTKGDLLQVTERGGLVVDLSVSERAELVGSSCTTISRAYRAHHTRQFAQSLIGSFWCVKYNLNFLVLAEQWVSLRHSVWSTAAVVHLLRCWLCCVFRDGFMCILFVTKGYCIWAIVYFLSSPTTLRFWYRLDILST